MNRGSKPGVGGLNSQGMEGNKFCVGTAGFFVDVRTVVTTYYYLLLIQANSK